MAGFSDIVWEGSWKGLPFEYEHKTPGAGPGREPWWESNLICHRGQKMGVSFPSAERNSETLNHSLKSWTAHDLVGLELRALQHPTPPYQVTGLAAFLTHSPPLGPSLISCLSPASGTQRRSQYFTSKLLISCSHADLQYPSPFPAGTSWQGEGSGRV